MMKGQASHLPRLGLSLPEVALSIGVSPNTVLKMVEEGVLPRPRIFGRRKIWRTVEIDAAMSEWPTDNHEDDFGPTDAWTAST